MWPKLPNKAPIYTHFWGCGIVGTKSKQGLEPCATVVAHLHTVVSHFLELSHADSGLFARFAPRDLLLSDLYSTPTPTPA